MHAATILKFVDELVFGNVLVRTTPVSATLRAVIPDLIGRTALGDLLSWCVCDRLLEENSCFSEYLKKNFFIKTVGIDFLCRF